MSMPPEGYIQQQLPQINSIWIDEDEETEKLYGLQAQLLRETGLDGDGFDFDIQLVNSTKPALNNKRNIELPPLRSAISNVKGSSSNNNNNSNVTIEQRQHLGHSKSKSSGTLLQQLNTIVATNPSLSKNGYGYNNNNDNKDNEHSGNRGPASRSNVFLSKKLLLNRRKFLKLFKNKVESESKKALISTPFDFHHISHAGNRLDIGNTNTQQPRSRITSMQSIPESAVDSLGPHSSSSSSSRSPQHPQLSKAFVTESLPEIYQSHSRDLSFSHVQPEQTQAMMMTMAMMQNHARTHSVTSSTYSSLASSERVKSMSTVATTILEGTPIATKRLSYGQSNRNRNNSNNHSNNNSSSCQKQTKWNHVRDEMAKMGSFGEEEESGQEENYYGNYDNDDDDRRSNSSELSISFFEKYNFPTLLEGDQQNYDLPYDDDDNDDEETTGEDNDRPKNNRRNLGTSFLDPAQSRLRKVQNPFNSQARFSINASPIRELLQSESKHASPKVLSPYKFLNDDSPVRTLSTPELEQLLFSDSQSRTVTVDDILRYYRDTISEMNSPYI